MKVDHVFGGHIYVISNFGVARNPLFKQEEDIGIFKENMLKYLGELCEIYAYSHEQNQFQYLVRIKEREVLETFFFKKQAASRKNVSHNLYGLESTVPPESYLIFSQEVSNCLNSYAKKFNRKYERKGGLFGDRYQKYLVESSAEMELWIEKLNKLEKLVKFSKSWKVWEKATFSNKNGECSSEVYYESAAGAKRHNTFRNFNIYSNEDLRGCFACLPPKSMKSPDFSQKFQNFLKINGVIPPW